MGSKRRGSDRIERCDSCGRTVPRTKAVAFTKRSYFTTDLRTNDNVSLATDVDVYYCISCGKHRKIFEKKKKLLEQQKNRGAY